MVMPWPEERTLVQELRALDPRFDVRTDAVAAYSLLGKDSRTTSTCSLAAIGRSTEIEAPGPRSQRRSQPVPYRPIR